MARYSPAEFVARLEAGEDPARLAVLNLPDDLRAVLEYAAPLRWVDAALWADVVQTKASATVPLETLRSQDLAYQVAMEPGRWFLGPETRSVYLDQWDPERLRRYSAELADVLRLRDEQQEALYHLMVADPAAAVDLFEDLFAEADAAFDLAAAKDLLDIFELPDRRHLVDDTLRDRLARRRAYISTRASWSNDYYRSAGFLERPRYADELRALEGVQGPRALQIVATGGMGKTMLLRWFAARYCIPRGVLTARIDFDEVDPGVATRYPWLVLLALAHQLNEQLPTRPFEELLDEHRRLLPALYRGTGRETSAAVLELSSVGDDPSLAGEVVQRYRSAMASRGDGDRALVIVFDTLETPLLPEDLDIGPLLTVVVDAHAADPMARLVLSGRYDLNRRPDLPAVLEPLGLRTVTIEEFTVEEGRTYLTDVRGIGRPDLVEAILAKGDRLPFTLALYADLAHQDPNLTAADVEEFEDARQLYLIERVLERIDDKAVRFVLRYGVVPRQLSKRFVAEVMRPYIARALDREAIGDEPGAEEHPRMAAAFRVVETAPELDVDELWDRLVVHAAHKAWVFFVEGLGGEYVSFHPNVREPMRLVLEGQEVLRRLHAAAAGHFRSLMAEEPHRRIRWAAEVAYHLFQAHGPAAAADWRDLLDEADRTSGPAGRAELAAALTADPDLTTHGGTAPAPWFGGEDVMSRATLAEAHLEVALAVLAGSIADGEGTWPEVERRLASVRAMERGADALVDPGRKAAVELALRGRSGDQAALAEVVGHLHAATDPVMLNTLLRVAMAHAGAIGSAELRRVEQRLAGRSDLVPVPGILAGLQSTLSSLLLAEGDVAGAEEEAARAAAAGGGDGLPLLPSLLKLARGASAEAAQLLAQREPDAESVRVEGAAWLAAGLPQRALEAGRRLTVTAPVQESTVQVDSTRSAVQVELEGRVAAALGDLREAVQLLDTSALRCREAGDLIRAAELWADLARLLLDHGRVRDAERHLEGAATATVPAGHRLWLTNRLLRARWLDRRGQGEDATGVLDEVLTELDARPGGPSALARAGLEGLAFAASPDPGRYAAVVDRAVASFVPHDAAMPSLTGLERCPPLPAATVAPMLHRLVEAARGTALADPHDQANHLLRLADLARLVGADDVARRSLVQASSVALEPGSLVLLRLLVTAARVGEALPDLDSILDRFVEQHRSHPALVLEALVAWARVVDDWRWLARADEMQSLLEQAGDPSQRNADVLLLRVEAARAGKIPGDVGALLDATRRLYAELGEEVLAGRLAAAAEAPPVSAGGPPEPEFGVLTVDERPGAVEVHFDGDRRLVPVTLLDPTTRVGDRTALTTRLVEDTHSVMVELREVLGAAVDGGADVCLRARSPRLAELPWELAWPGMGAPVLFRGTRDRPAGIRHMQRALGDQGYATLADGVLGPQTRAAVSTYQRDHGLPVTGEVDRATRRSLWQTTRGRPSVLVLRRSHRVALTKGRALRSEGDLEAVYREQGFAVEVRQDPTFDDLRRIDSRPAVIHIQAELESLGGSAGLSFARTLSRSASEYGVESLTVTAVDELVARATIGLGPIVVLHALTPPGTWEAARQLLLRNMFAADLFELGSTPAILAIGPFSSGWPADIAVPLAHALSGRSHEAGDLGQLWRMLLDDVVADGRDLFASPAAIALFAEDPAAVVLRP